MHSTSKLIILISVSLKYHIFSILFINFVVRTLENITPKIRPVSWSHQCCRHVGKELCGVFAVTVSPGGIADISKYRFPHAGVTFQCSWDIWQAKSPGYSTLAPQTLRLSTILIHPVGFQNSFSNSEKPCTLCKQESYYCKLKTVVVMPAAFFKISIWTPFLFSVEINLEVLNSALKLYHNTIEIN